MKDRILKILEQEDIQPSRFAEVIGVQRSSISHILSGRNNPSFDMIQAILKNFPTINPDWLILGKGNLYRTTIQPSLFSANEPAHIEKATSIPLETEKEIDLEEDKPVENGSEEVVGYSKPLENRLNEVDIDHVLVFYKDNTFRAYRPREEK